MPLVNFMLRHYFSGLFSLFLIGYSLASSASEQAQLDFLNTYPPLSESGLLNSVGERDRLAELELSVRLSESRGSFVENPSEALRWYNRAARYGTRARDLQGNLSITVDQLPLPVIRSIGDGDGNGSGNGQTNQAPHR